MAGITRKARRTFSLSRESLDYLEKLQKAKRHRSISSLLDELIRRQQEANDMRAISASISSYYDSLNEEQAAEQRAWGQFAESQWSNED
ncbi:MAG TPA: hypothetical protein VFI95_22660 [Terriglobales bacterium]|nr:hypothetical protein [Terriglobales bacterium]